MGDTKLTLCSTVSLILYFASYIVLIININKWKGFKKLFANILIVCVFVFIGLFTYKVSVDWSISGYRFIDDRALTVVTISMSLLPTLGLISEIKNKTIRVVSKIVLALYSLSLVILMITTINDDTLNSKYMKIENLLLLVSIFIAVSGTLLYFWNKNKNNEKP